jgi:hypothetical protein
MRGERNEEKKRKERGRESRTCGAIRVKMGYSSLSHSGGDTWQDRILFTFKPQLLLISSEATLYTISIIYKLLFSQINHIHKDIKNEEG